MRIAQWTGLWALLCLCSIVAPGVADADWKIDRARAVAAQAWNNPCPGRVQILYAPPKQPSWLASAIKGYCQITLSDREAWPWKQLCPVLVHEYGHLAGYRDPLNPSDPFHSHDPNDIMFAYIHSDWRCRDYGTPFWAMHSHRTSSPIPNSASAPGSPDRAELDAQPPQRARKDLLDVRERRQEGAASRPPLVRLQL